MNLSCNRYELKTNMLKKQVTAFEDYVMQDGRPQSIVVDGVRWHHRDAYKTAWDVAKQARVALEREMLWGKQKIENERRKLFDEFVGREESITKAERVIKERDALAAAIKKIRAALKGMTA